MLTEETYKQLKLFFKLNSRLSCLPFKYDEATRKLKQIPAQSKAWYFFMLSFHFVRGVYHISWFVSNFYYGFPSVTDTTIELFYALNVFTIVGLNFGVFLSRASLIDFVNQLLVISRILRSEFLSKNAKLGGRHPKTRNKFSDGCWVYMKLLTPSCYSTALSFGFLFLLQPNKRLYYYYLIPGDKPVWYLAVYFVAEFYTYCWNMPILYFFWYVLLLSGNCFGFWLQQIGQSKPDKMWTKQSLYQTRLAITIFKAIQILTIQFNNCFRALLLPIANLFVLGTHVICIFVCVKFHNVLEIPFMLAFACGVGLCSVFEFVTYPLMGNVYEHSVAFLLRSNGNGGKEWRKTMKALPAIGFSVGSCYLIQKQTVLTFTSLVCTMASNLLVSTA